MTEEKNIDWAGVRDDLRRQIMNDASAFLVGKQDDIQAFAQEISNDMTEALMRRRSDLVDELRGQIRAKGEALRLEGVREGWQTVEQTVEALLAFGFKLLAV